MSISKYHKQYMEKSDTEIARRALVKKRELEQIFNVMPFVSNSDPVDIFVVGCGDKRFIDHHKEIFSQLLDRSVNITTSDIVTDHLKDGEDVIEHDATRPFPGAPYDVVYAHVFLKFIPAEKQFNVLINSYDALRDGGVAIHVLDESDIEDGMVDLQALTERLTSNNVQYFEMKLSVSDVLPSTLYSRALVLKK